MIALRYIFQHHDGKCASVPVSAYSEADARRALARYVKAPTQWLLIGTDDYVCPADAERNRA